MPPTLDAASLSDRYTLVTDWKAMDATDADAIRGFWRDEGAVTDPAAVERRLAEVVLHACDEEGRIAAICTAFPSFVVHFGQTYYQYRCFVGKAHRSSYLLRQLTVGAINILEHHARSNDYPCVGVLAELENPRFRSAMSRFPIWRGKGVELIFVGRSPRGLDVRLHYFRGARLQVPEPRKLPDAVA